MAWLQILEFIKPNPNDGKNILVTHNGRRFDHKIMHFYLDQICQQKNEACDDILTVDSLDIFKQFKPMMPLGTKTAKGKQRYIFGEEQVYLHLFHPKPEFSHEALYDCIYLLRILLHLATSKEKLLQLVISIKSLPLSPPEIAEVEKYFSS